MIFLFDWAGQPLRCDYRPPERRFQSRLIQIKEARRDRQFHPID